ncbi:hypothetical protein TNCV_680371, partial [Trichonephila clavipes]
MSHASDNSSSAHCTRSSFAVRDAEINLRPCSKTGLIKEVYVSHEEYQHQHPSPFQRYVF